MTTDKACFPTSPISLVESRIQHLDSNVTTENLHRQIIFGVSGNQHGYAPTLSVRVVPWTVSLTGVADSSKIER